MSSITHLDSISDLTATISSAKEKLVVIDFHATWCGPCHAIAPRYEALSKQYKDVVFTKSDVDKAQDVAQKYSVSAMPSFVFLKNGQKVDLVRGADPAGLENAIKRHSSGGSGGSSAFGGKGQTLGGASNATGVTPGGDTLQSLQQLDPQIKILLLLAGAYLSYVLFFSG